MKWVFNEPKIGDAVRVKINEIYHYGICTGEDQIIQFGLPPTARQNIKQQDIEVCFSDVETFLQGGFLECGKAERKDGKKRSSKQVIEYAKSQVGKKDYHILYNNCEHFVYECLFGQKKSLQTEGVRDYILSLPIADVYTMAIPEEYTFSTLYPSIRQSEIESTKNQKVKEEKYFAWRLLEYALMRTFGYKIDRLNFEKTENGKWVLDNCYISLSHSHGMVAVAVSKKPIGADVELIEKPKNNAIERVLNRLEKKAFKKVEDKDKDRYLLTTWSKKESAYKKIGKGKFLPSKIDTVKHSFFEKFIKENGKEYILTVCSEFSNEVRHFERVNLD